MTRSIPRLPHRVALPLACLLAWLPGLGIAQSLDVVQLTDKSKILGEILALNPTDVEIRDQRDSQTKRVPIDRIALVAFGDEPASLREARSLLLRQDAAGAIDELAKIEKGELEGAPDKVLTDVDFVRAAATARRATATGTDLTGGEKALRDFVQKHPNSHLFFTAYELLGDLLVRAEKFDEAAAAYATMEKGPPALAVRAATAKAGSFYAQKKYAEAEKEYAAAEKNRAEVEAKAEKDRQEAEQKRAEAEKSKATKDLIEWKQKEAGAQQEKDGAARQKLEARTGRARCLARQGKAGEAVNVLQGVTREANPEDREFLGRVYAALGDASRTAGKEQDALIAFLTVDLVYNSVPDSHAEALYNLVELWQKAQNPERSREARQSLETSYPDSRWTKALGAAAGKG